MTKYGREHPRSIEDEQVTEVVYKTLKEHPREETQWTVRFHGEGSGGIQGLCASHLACLRVTAPPTKTLQTLHRSLFVEKLRDIGSISKSSRTCHGAMCG